MIIPDSAGLHVRPGQWHVMQFLHPTPRLVIHGGFTVDNVIASGNPASAAGVIDFALAYIDAPMADIGFGLWRSGRSPPGRDPARSRSGRRSSVVSCK